LSRATPIGFSAQDWHICTAQSPELTSLTGVPGTLSERRSRGSRTGIGERGLEGVLETLVVQLLHSGRASGCPALRFLPLLSVEENVAGVVGLLLEGLGRRGPGLGGLVGLRAQLGRGVRQLLASGPSSSTLSRAVTRVAVLVESECLQESGVLGYRAPTI
jgi:hypothetical protein